MMHAYSELYLDDAMLALGDMFEYAICDCGYEPDLFFSQFITSGIAEKFGCGNPKYNGGMSGVELASEVIFLTTGNRPNTPIIQHESHGKEYWAGWIMAYYQWYSGLTFSDMAENGLSVSEVMSMYILHEADESKFVEAADEIIARHKKEKLSKLSIVRKARGFTQQQLADSSGVALRMVQLYEQRQNDIGKAQASVVIRLAKSLGCEVEDLLE